MLSRVMMKTASAVFAAAVVTGAGTPLASAATGGGTASSSTTGGTFRIFQMINGFKVCLDSGFEFSVCQTSPNPDDPPALQKWALVSAANGAIQVENSGQCLDVTTFTAPCTKGDSNQQWVRVSVGNGTTMLENTSSAPAQCLDSMWTFKTCTQGDKQQVWTIKHRL